MDNTKRLYVLRTMEDGTLLKVGRLAQDNHSTYFAYDESYLDLGNNISPFKLRWDAELQQAPRIPHNGLFGVFNDSLPDGWGHLVMNRLFRQEGIDPSEISPMDRLAFTGDRGIGALSYRPMSEGGKQSSGKIMTVWELGQSAQQALEGQTPEIVAMLAQTGSPHGARPKTAVFLKEDDFNQCSTLPAPGFVPFLIKFTTFRSQLGHQEGVCEAAYLEAARRSGIEVPEFALLTPPEGSESPAWLALKRFDVTKEGGRYHTLSVSGMLDAPHTEPCFDYENLIRATSTLCEDSKSCAEMLKRSIFNLLAMNRDDHTKNFSYMCDDAGRWRPTPAYDLAFNRLPEHSMAYSGRGARPNSTVVRELSKHAGVSARQLSDIIYAVQDALVQFPVIAKDFGANREAIQTVQKGINEAGRENANMLATVLRPRPTRNG